MTEKEALVALCAFPGAGPTRIKLLIEYFGSAKKAWKAGEKTLVKIGFGEERTKNFLNHKDRFDPSSYFLRLKRLGIAAITFDDKNYPENLKSLRDFPLILYVKGELKKEDNTAIAVVGSRKMTAYGKIVCERLVTDLVTAGVTIVSGLALGVDAVAHKTAIDAGGRTMAVVGGGLDQIYPPANTNLAREIVKHGTIISEYPLGYPALSENFPVRNRIVSGLSLGVLVIEGAQKSGTLLTASHAASQGREVFAVPGQITSPNSAAPHFLLKNGAKLVTSAQDLLEELEIKSKVKSQTAKVILPQSPQEQKVLEILANEGLDIDTIVRISGIETGTVLGVLTNMELKGLVKNIGGIYTKA